MHRRSLPLFLALGFLVLGVPQWPGSPDVAVARAQPRRALPPLETDPRLGPVFSRGVEAMLGQRFDEALTVFEDLFRQTPRPTLLYYLGKVAQGQGRAVAAYDLYRRFLRGAGTRSTPTPSWKCSSSWPARPRPSARSVSLASQVRCSPSMAASQAPCRWSRGWRWPRGPPPAFDPWSAQGRDPGQPAGPSPCRDPLHAGARWPC